MERKLAGLVDAISEGLRDPGLHKQLDQFEARRAGLETKIAAPAASAPRMHPNLAQLYRERGQSCTRHYAAIRTEGA